MAKASTWTEWSMTRSTGTSGIDLPRVAAQGDHGVAHRGEVDHRRDAGEVLHQHARRAVGDLLLGRPRIQPGAHRLEVLDRDAAAVLEPEQVLEQHLERERQARQVAKCLLGLRNGEVVVGEITHRQATTDLQHVMTGYGQRSSPEDASTMPRSGGRPDLAEVCKL